MATPERATDKFLLDEALSIDQAIAWEKAKALRALAAEVGRLADVYLYCNDPEPEGEQPSGLGGSLSDVPSKAGWEARGGD